MLDTSRSFSQLFNVPEQYHSSDFSDFFHNFINVISFQIIVPIGTILWCEIYISVMHLAGAPPEGLTAAQNNLPLVRSLLGNSTDIYVR